MKAAARKVSPSVVQIVTEGGTDMVVTTPQGPGVSQGPGPDHRRHRQRRRLHHLQRVQLPQQPDRTFSCPCAGHTDPFPAKKIATDRNRMLTLIKIDKTGLPVPAGRAGSRRFAKGNGRSPWAGR